MKVRDLAGVWLGEGAADDGAVVFGKGGSIA